ncbi:hypothetical protein GCM10010168_57020 [Actinoplanes ianthinogenes]|uniref:DUF3455 domain-containing protein n=1 Tax=Actinoplanes ianthinogenes TaxID=122358 RepID=A0ABM7M2K7_9ACTN|nr:DUF3455 domain-containing protein [Actinoplanes ianthinogenes]BCJ45878.1 hypothetical protein Aiant_65350 [Actinoplanes ianthinogenes]GGR31400.1 hypothetical protein GCM10010168_57020 [Actinoplanes ianthinogenes]
MFRTKRSRIRALTLAGGLVAALGTVGAVTFDASAAENTAASGNLRPLTPAVSAVPEAIRPPDGSRPIGAYLVATGTQTYTCVVPAGAASGAFTGGSVPEAQLVGTGGWIHHFAGPSWQSERDGSLVTATKEKELKRDGTIAELLLKVNSHSGTGILSKADYINRLYTSGGVAPAGSCTAGQTASVAYKAVYVFWDAPAA